jgi:uncharacterized phage-associated protein
MSNMPYSTKAVANEFLELAEQEGKSLTPMQLQKLVYFAYGWYLAITDEYLIDERVEAWQWGPVAPSLYGELKRYGSSFITDKLREVTFRDGKALFVPARIHDELSPEKEAYARQLIRRVWEVYGKYSGSQLSNMTHAPDSPWSLTPNKDIRGTDIPDDLIKAYFHKIAKRA